MGDAREKAIDLKEKASMLASVHSEEYRHHKRWDALLSLSSLFASIFILAFSFAQGDIVFRELTISESTYRSIFALLAFFSICISLGALFFQPGIKSARNREAVVKYSKLKNRIEQQLSAGENITSDYLSDLQNLYLAGEDVPIITDKRFLKLKRRYFNNERISDEIKKDRPTE